MEINPSTLRNIAAHKFVVYPNGDQNGSTNLEICVAEESNHPRTAQRFGIRRDKPKAGGSLFLESDVLVLAGFSSDYGPIPTEIARNFTGLLIEELRKKGIYVKGAEVRVGGKFMDTYWENLGFIEESTIDVF